MINFIETLFGIGAVALVIALVCAVRKKRQAARRFGLVGFAAGAVGLALELYVRSR